MAQVATAVVRSLGMEAVEVALDALGAVLDGVYAPSLSPQGEDGWQHAGAFLQKQTDDLVARCRSCVEMERSAQNDRSSHAAWSLFQGSVQQGIRDNLFMLGVTRT